MDKTNGYLPVDRPRRTYCGQRVAALCRKAEVGYANPLGICLVSEGSIGAASATVL